MRQDNFSSVLNAYRTGFASDFLQGKYSNKWTTYWNVPPCSPEALSRAGQQFTFSRAQAIRHFRRAVWAKHKFGARRVVVITELPSREQTVYCLETLQLIRISRFLSDAALEALIEAFSPSAHFPLIEALCSLSSERE